MKAERTIPKDVADLLKEIISLDGQATGELKASDGTFCFIGGLKACIDPDWAIKDYSLYYPDSTEDAIEQAERHLGLRVDTLWGAAIINDSSKTLPYRRRSLKLWIDHRTIFEE